jgi:selenoprotein W-related protein
MPVDELRRIRITYCDRCKWLARAAWYAQELLSTYAADINEVALAPADDAGVFRIEVGTVCVMDRSTDGFLEAKLLKRRVRDLIAPGRALGHVDQSSDSEKGLS